jgi:NTP pyrophosphatase (non-canonical NTP hydrolase)
VEEAEMNFKSYEKAAWSTFKLDKSPMKIPYLALGIAGEAGEVADKIKKLIRDCGNGEMPAITDEQRKSLKLELGDVLWYVSCLGKALGFELEEIADANIEKLASRQNRGVIGGSGDNR